LSTAFTRGHPVPLKYFQEIVKEPGGFVHDNEVVVLE
jgi:hypothetical protein